MLKIHCPLCGEVIKVPVMVDTVMPRAEGLRVTWRASDVKHSCPNPALDRHR